MPFRTDMPIGRLATRRPAQIWGLVSKLDGGRESERGEGQSAGRCIVRHILSPE